jgi:hypothetical protein
MNESDKHSSLKKYLNNCGSFVGTAPGVPGKNKKSFIEVSLKNVMTNVSFKSGKTEIQFFPKI